jgi:hypothetical protein
MTPHTDEALSIHSEPIDSRSRLMRFGPWLAVVAFIVVGVARIVSTYHVFNEVFDEAPHIAAGMEWWQEGTYNYERKHTPLARAAVALPLYLRGIRGQNLPDMIDEGHQILYERNEYFTNLAWARSGNLPFFILSNILLFLWGRRWWGPWTGVAAVGLFSALPPILGHAAIATTDVAAVCGLLATVYAFCVWLEKPDARQTLILGVAMALAMLAKLSVVPFFAIGAAATLAWTGWRRLPVGIWAPVPISRQIRNISMAVLVAALVIWAPYHFRLAPMSTGHGYRPPTASLGRVGPIVDYLLDAKLPLGEFLGGAGSVAAFNKLGYMAFFEGAYRDKGWWSFFPTVLAIKTPITVLLLIFAGIPLSLRRLRGAEWQQGVPLIFAAGVLLSCMMSSLNLGVRHIIPIFPLLMLVAAPALVWLFEHARQRRWTGILAVLLLIGFGIESALPHPDYLAAFNLLAGSKPEKIIVSSDLDWGQDLQRLSIRLKELKVPSLSLLYSGASVVSRFDLPPFVEFKPTDNPTGWVAVSVTRMMLDCAKDGNYCSWKDRTPVERVGRSIYLFYVPPGKS